MDFSELLPGTRGAQDLGGDLLQYIV
jgi:hypothetical protein